MTTLLKLWSCKGDFPPPHFQKCGHEKGDTFHDHTFKTVVVESGLSTQKCGHRKCGLGRVALSMTTLSKVWSWIMLVSFFYLVVRDFEFNWIIMLVC